MIDALWLLLIVPVAAFIGFMACAFLAVGKDQNDQDKTERI